MPHQRFERVMKMNRQQFKRRTGVYPEMFWEMEAVLQAREQVKKRSGRPAALSPGEQLLLILEFWREYRTLSHLAEDWDVHESTAQRTIERVENTLVQSGTFALPGKKALVESETVWSAVLVDVTEVPCERPQKNNERGTAERRNATP